MCSRRIQFIQILFARLKTGSSDGRLSSKLLHANLGNQYREILESFGIVCVDESYSNCSGLEKAKKFGLKRLNIYRGSCPLRAKASLIELAKRFHKMTKRAAKLILSGSARIIKGSYMEHSRRFMRSKGIRLKAIKLAYGRHEHAGARVKKEKTPGGLVEIDQHGTAPWLLHRLAVGISPDEAEKWCSMFRGGRFYDEVRALSGTGKGKSGIIATFNNANFAKWRKDSLVKWFFREFPTIAKRLAAKMKEGASKVSKEFFIPMESRLWGRAWVELDREKVGCYRKHDAILTTEEDVPKVLKKISAIADDVFGRQPVLKITRY